MNNINIYHITHIDNLHNIVMNGGLLSDYRISEYNISPTEIGMKKIKDRRLREKTCPIFSETYIGQYVPFNFCPRSVMLYIIYRGNHSEVAFSGGQQEIIHLECNVNDVINWARSENINWVFCDRNASDELSNFYNNIQDFGSLDWSSIRTNTFSDKTIRSKKQAEFLIYGLLPFRFVKKIGIYNESIRNRVIKVLEKSSCKDVEICVNRNWYF